MAKKKSGVFNKNRRTAQPKKQVDWKEGREHLFQKAPRDFRIGRNIQPKKDLSRYVRWPRYIRVQRQRAILTKRLKIPPPIQEFATTLDKNHAGNLLRLLSHYRPESKQEKKERLKKTAGDAVSGQDIKNRSDATKPKVLKFGLNHVTTLVEQKKAKLVVIAHDVDPIELVVWLPALCRTMDVPFVIIKGKARLGSLVHQKTAAVVALTEVRKDDVKKLDQMVSAAKTMFGTPVTKWGNGVMGIKRQHVEKKLAALALKGKK